jgi:predicted ATP-grasp superfamily ATP-dependent carboligase
MVYQDTIIPETQAMYDALMHQFGLDKEGYYLIADFSHLPILQEDEQANANTLRTRVDAVEKLLSLGLIDTDEAKIIIGYEK